MNDALSTNLNDVHIDSVSAPDSPAVDSVATPINNSLVPDIKIDVDFAEQESDARHEPAPLNLDKLDDASVVPQVATPVDPGTCQSSPDASLRAHDVQDSIPIAPPHGTPPPPLGELLEDVKMAEEISPPKAEDVEMSGTSGKANGLPNGQTNDTPVATPVSPSLPAAVSSSETAVDSHAASSPYANNTNANNDDDDHDKPPPAKRARKYSDAERASLANVSTSFLLCAIMGVLIYILSSFRSEDRYSTSSLRLSPSSDKRQRSSGVQWSLHFVASPVAFLPVDSAHAQADEGRGTFPQPRRPCCTGYTPLPQHHQASHGLLHHRA